MTGTGERLQKAERELAAAKAAQGAAQAEHLYRTHGPVAREVALARLDARAAAFDEAIGWLRLRGEDALADALERDCFEAVPA